MSAPKKNQNSPAGLLVGLLLLLLVVIGGWMVQELESFTREIFQAISQL